MASKSVEDVPFPGIDVQVEAVSDSSGILVKEAMSTARPGPCPNYQKQARRLHSTYQRTLNEQPLGTRRVIVRLRVRRYFRARKSCSRTTFVEQIRGLSTRYRRSNTGLAGSLRSIAIKLRRRPTARLRRRLRLTASRTRLPRLLTAPAVPDRAPRVLGVDEFAFRKGRTYATVLIDQQAHDLSTHLHDRRLGKDLRQTVPGSDRRSFLVRTTGAARPTSRRTQASPRKAGAPRPSGNPTPHTAPEP